MATIGIRAPLRFHGTPQLVEGLAPFQYADVLGGAVVQVTLPGKASTAPLPTNIQALARNTLLLVVGTANQKLLTTH